MSSKETFRTPGINERTNEQAKVHRSQGIGGSDLLHQNSCIKQGVGVDVQVIPAKKEIK